MCSQYQYKYGIKKTLITIPSRCEWYRRVPSTWRWYQSQPTIDWFHLLLTDVWNFIVSLSPSNHSLHPSSAIASYILSHQSAKVFNTWFILHGVCLCGPQYSWLRGTSREYGGLRYSVQVRWNWFGPVQFSPEHTFKVIGSARFDLWMFGCSVQYLFYIASDHMPSTSK